MARRREWQDFMFGGVIANGARTVTNLIRSDQNEAKGMTLIRTIVRLDLNPNPPGDAGAQRISLGIGMFATEAEAIGVTAMADPALPEDKPLTGWLWRSSGAVLDTGAGNVIWRIDEDIRAQRKVMYGAPSLMVTSVASFGVAFPTELTGIIRCLYLLD